MIHDEKHRSWLNRVKKVRQLDLKNKIDVKNKTLQPLFMDGVQLPQGYRVTARRQRQFTFYH